MYRSIAYWPKGTVSHLSTSAEVTEDSHDSWEAANAVCLGLEREGFGGMGKVFPILSEVISEPYANEDCPISYLYKQTNKMSGMLSRLSVYKVHMILSDHQDDHHVAVSVVASSEDYALEMGKAEMRHWYPSDEIEVLYAVNGGNVIVEGRDFAKFE